MKVLHVITAANAGGSETMLARLLERSPGQPDQTGVLTLLPPGPVGERIREQGVRLYTLGMRRGFWSPLAALRLARIVNVFAPDIIHGWMYNGSFAATLASGMLARPVSVIWNIRNTLAGHSLEAPRNRALLRLNAWFSSNPDAIVYNSLASSLQHREFGYWPDRNIVIPNGFDCSIYRPDETARGRLCEVFGIDPGSLVIGHIARHHPMKDHATLVEAVARARGEGLDIHLLLVGDGLEQPPRTLREHVHRLLPANRITISGQRRDVSRWLPGLDILAMSSAWGEGFPNVIGEALACGVPVVSTDVGDSAAIVGDCGAVVPPSSPEAFAVALAHLGNMGQDQRRRMGLAGRDRIIGLYSLDKIARRYHDLHSRLFDDSRYLGKPVFRQDRPAEGLRR